jgi:hypothetical protein
MSQNLEPGATIPDLELPDENGGLHRPSECRATTCSCSTSAGATTVRGSAVGYRFWGRPTIHRLWTDLQEIHIRIKADFDPTTPEARATWKAAQAAVASA